MNKNKDFYQAKHDKLTKKIEQVDIDNKKDLINLIKSLNLYKYIQFNDINSENAYYEILKFDYTKILSEGLQLDVEIEPNHDYTTFDLKINSICREGFNLFQEFNEIYQIFQKDIFILRENKEKVLSVLFKNYSRIKKQQKIKIERANNITDFELFLHNLSVDKIKHVFKPNTININSMFENKNCIEVLNYSFNRHFIIFKQYNISIENRKNNTIYKIDEVESTKERVEQIINDSFFFKGKLATSFEDFSEFRPRFEISDLADILEPEILKLNIDSF